MAAIGTDLTKITWRNGNAVAGGIVSRMGRTSSGMKYHRTDTNGSYVWDTVLLKWVQTVRPAAFPANEVGEAAYYNGDPRSTGTYALEFCWGDDTKGYQVYLGSVFKTTNMSKANVAAATWTKTTLTGYDGTAAGANNNSRQGGPYMRVDPANASHVIVCFYKGVPQRTTDGGTTWTAVSGVPESADATYNAPMMVEVARGSGTTGGKTNIWYIWRPGAGLYKSTDCGATFSIVASTPVNTTANNLACDNSNPGTLYMALNVAGSTTLTKYNGTSFSTVSTNLNNASENPAQFVSCKHDDVNTVVIGHNGGAQSISSNGGTSFVGLPAPNPIIGGSWRTFTLNDSKTSGQGVWNDDGTFEMGMGTGTLKATLPTTSVQFNWTDTSIGNEQLIFEQMVTPPVPLDVTTKGNGRFGKSLVIAGCQDRYVMTLAPGIQPTQHGPNNMVGSNIGNAHTVCYSKVDPTVVYALCEKAKASTTGVFKSNYPWTTWAKTAAAPSYMAQDSYFNGAMDSGRVSDIVVFPHANRRPEYTNDGGATWNLCTFPVEVPTTGDLGWCYAPAYYFLTRRIIAVDHVNTDTYYAYNYITPGTYKSTDRGANWTRLNSTNIDPIGGNGVLASVPGQAGHLFFIPGIGNTLGVDTSLYMYRSTDGGQNWSQVLNGGTGIREPQVIAFGKNLAGSSYPAVAFVGYLNGNYGHYVSLDNCATWTRTAEFPAENMQIPRCMTGDMNAFGVWNIGFGGAGYATSDFELTIHCT